MNWVQRKIYLYNVTFGLYMLEWWERLLFNAVVLVLMWFVCLHGFHHISEIYSSILTLGQDQLYGEKLLEVNKENDTATLIHKLAGFTIE